MELKPVQGSSQIEAAGYDAASRTLAIVFKGTPATYQYQNVPPEKWQEFESAPSKGAFVFRQIKGKFAHQKIEATAA